MKTKNLYLYLTFLVIFIGTSSSLICSNYSEIAEAIKEKYCSNS